MSAAQDVRPKRKSFTKRDNTFDYDVHDSAATTLSVAIDNPPKNKKQKGNT